MMNGTEVVGGAEQKHGRLQGFEAVGGMATAPGQGSQTLAEGGVEPFDEGSVNQQAAVRTGELAGDKLGCAAHDVTGEVEDLLARLGGMFDDTGNGQRR